MPYPNTDALGWNLREFRATKIGHKTEGGKTTPPSLTPPSAATDAPSPKLAKRKRKQKRKRSSGSLFFSWIFRADFILIFLDKEEKYLCWGCFFVSNSGCLFRGAEFVSVILFFCWFWGGFACDCVRAEERLWGFVVVGGVLVVLP